MIFSMILEVSTKCSDINVVVFVEKVLLSRLGIVTSPPLFVIHR